LVVKMKNCVQHVNLCSKHPYVSIVSRALNNANAIHLAILFEWEPMRGMKAKLFADAVKKADTKKVGGLAMSHFMSVARQYHVPQAILVEISGARRYGRVANIAGKNGGKTGLSKDAANVNTLRRTKLLIDILLERALPAVTIRNGADIDGLLMEEVVVI